MDWRKGKWGGGGPAAVGKMAYQSLRLEYLQIPPVSRAYTTACVLKKKKKKKRIC